MQEVDFTGGEPLLRADWADIALYLRDLGISTTILTNGLVVEPDIISQIKDAGISKVGISLDGLEQTHDRIRGRKGSFEHVIRSIKMLMEANLPFIVITTVNALNIHELPAILQLLQSIGVRCWRLQPVIPTGRVKKPWRGCPAGLVSCDIMSDGKVKGCSTMPDGLVEGDLRKKDLWDIWFHPNSFAYNRRFSLDQLGPNCRSCDKAAECLGGCSGFLLGFLTILGIMLEKPFKYQTQFLINGKNESFFNCNFCISSIFCYSYHSKIFSTQ